MITATLKKLAVRAYYTLYFAAQCFILERDPEILSMIDGVPRSPSQSILKHGQPYSFQSGMSAPIPLDDLEYSEVEPEDFDGKPKDSDHEPVLNEEDSDVANPNWEWPIYDTIYNKDSSNTLKRHEKNAKNSTPAPFSVVYLNLKDLPWASQVAVRIHSASLIETIKVLMPGLMDQSAILNKEVKLDRPKLFRIYEKLKNEQTSIAKHEALTASTTGNIVKQLHLNHLLRFLDQEFEHIKPMLASMSTSEQKVSWEMLWIYFPQGERVCYKDDVSDEDLCGDVLETCYCKDDEDKMIFKVEVSKWDYNCRTWTNYSNNPQIPIFKGERAILELNIFPVQFTSSPQATIKEFKKQGKRFCQLSMLERNCFMNYKGSMMR
jgi:hypothetical protein